MLIKTLLNKVQRLNVLKLPSVWCLQARDSNSYLLKKVTTWLSTVLQWATTRISLCLFAFWRNEYNTSSSPSLLFYVLTVGQQCRRGKILTLYRRENMRLLLAIFLPWFQFFTIGRPFTGIFCLLLQLTIIGWLPAAIWSAYALSQYKTDKKIKKALAAVR